MRVSTVGKILISLVFQGREEISCCGECTGKANRRLFVVQVHPLFLLITSRKGESHLVFCGCDIFTFILEKRLGDCLGSFHNLESLRALLAEVLAFQINTF